ncbi:MAG: hypothetical protein Q8R95_12515 [Azonexus sp.]|nr:hypothetical protein [Azonexus sp.]
MVTSYASGLVALFLESRFIEDQSGTVAEVGIGVDNQSLPDLGSRPIRFVQHMVEPLVVLVTDVSWMDKPMRVRWQKLGGVGMIESAQEIKGKLAVEWRYFIVSVGIKTVTQFADAVRAHWGV